MNLSNDRPEKIKKLGHSLFAYNYQITEVSRQVMYENEQETNGFEFKTVTFDHLPTIGEVINAIICQAFPNGEENAIQRKGILDNDNAEFKKYNQFVELTKSMVKQDFL
jgi:hypothetical protein